ncbi:lamina-associated polypeptide 2, isoforms beta/delta/epsilon/gamma-like [Saccoglossus kowalevskii]
MSTIVADPSVLTKDRLKSDLQSHNIPLPSGDARKDAYVKLYLKHLTPLIAKKHRDSPKRSEFSSDEESTPRVRGERKKTTKKSSSSRVISRDDIEIEKDVANLSDTELASALQELGATIGPITATTRSVYERKLIKLRSGQTQIEQDEESDDYSDSDEEQSMAAPPATLGLGPPCLQLHRHANRMHCLHPFDLLTRSTA